VENTVVWRHQWEWMSGREPSGSCDAREEGCTLLDVLSEVSAGSMQQKIDAVHQLGRIGDPEAISALIGLFCAEEPVRQAAIYNLARVGAGAVKQLQAELRRPLANKFGANGRAGWNEGAVVMEDAAYALAAIGVPAVAGLTGMLRSKSEWVRINAAFALGEIGPRASSAMPALIRLLKDESHPVVRTALDAIGQIGSGARAALPEIKRLLAAPNETAPESWIAPQRRKWAGLGQVRLNAVMALLRMGCEADGAEDWLGEFLDDDCGYVGGFGVEFLLRRKTAVAKDTALDYLYRHRWDNTLRGGVRTF
jgi:HEAT repeat protein